MEVDIMTLFEKFKDKTLFITVQNGTLFPTYKGTILSQVEDFIEFKTENNTIWINLKYIVKFIVVEQRAFIALYFNLLLRLNNLMKL